MADAFNRTGGSTPARKAPRVRPVRVSLDLEPSTHKTLKVMALEAEVPLVIVLRTLIDTMMADPALRDQVAATATEHHHQE